MALTTAFVTAVRRQGAIPSSFADVSILAMGDGEIQAVFIPLLESLRQNFFVREITASPDARGKVPVPIRAVAAGLRNVQLAVNNSWVSLPNRAMEEADYLTNGLPSAYYLDAGSIAFLPTGSSGTVRIRYAARPGRMVLDNNLSSCAPITAVVTGSTTTALTAAGYAGPTVVDLVSSGPAHQQKAISITPTVGPVVLNSDLLETPIPGDYLTAADTSPFVPLPEELYAALVHRTAGVVLRSYGYNEEASQQLSVADECIQRATPMLIPRNEGNPQRIKGGLRSALNRRGVWRSR